MTEALPIFHEASISGMRKAGTAFRSWNRLIRFLAMIALILAATLASAAWAQDSIDGLAAQKADADTYLTLTDQQVRQILLNEIKEKRADQPEQSAVFNPAKIAHFFNSTLGDLSKHGREIFGAYQELPGIFSRGFDAFSKDQSPGSGGRFVVALFVSLAIGGIATVGFWRFLAAGNGPVSEQQTLLPSAFDKLSLHASAIFRQILSICLFAATASLIYFVFFDESAKNRLAFVFYLVPICLFWFATAFLTAFYSPGNERLRLPSFTNDQALNLFATMLIAVGFGAFAFFTCALINTLGVSGPVHDLFLVTVTGIAALLMSLSFALNRAAIEQDLNVGPSRSRSRFARYWAGFLIALPPLVWALLVIMELIGDAVPYGAGLLTLLLAGVYPHIDALLVRSELDLQQDKERGFSYALINTLRPLGAALIAIVFLASWHLFAVAGLSEDDNGLRQYWNTLVNSLFYILVGLSLWNFSNIYISQQIEKEDALSGNADDLGEMEIGGTGLSRTRTLLPLIKRAIQALVIATVSMAILTAAGVDIAPVLAGAGVVGLAIGFGSQTLVRDIVSGAFFLIDDAVRIGEYIDTGSVKGVVERMSVRSLQLRHHRGAVHTIPFGEIQTLTNYSRDWAIMKLRFTVPFDTDLEKVRKLLKKAGQELSEKEDIKDDFLQPFKAQGAVEASDYGFVISTKFMSKPGKQFVIRRHAFATVQKVFEANGIQFARPTISVSSNSAKDDPETEGAAGLLAHANARN
ncbi:mechanosensitive ion channel family protein [Roseibium sediminis]|uniref:mechanosensitive ion channel family protein n=1 Tax=Roseibium sediminis TaxID=1775174 RepID=UPI00123D2450|nr:mechanosensitive ion channel domain-containing protein [Roseibium sediminis]